MAPWPGAQASIMRGISLQRAFYSGIPDAKPVRLHRTGAWCALGALNACTILGPAKRLQCGFWWIFSGADKESAFTQITLDAGVLQAVFVDGRSLKTGKAW
jgi:hypothetical protein